MIIQEGSEARTPLLYLIPVFPGEPLTKFWCFPALLWFKKRAIKYLSGCHIGQDIPNSLLRRCVADKSLGPYQRQSHHAQSYIFPSCERAFGSSSGFAFHPASAHSPKQIVSSRSTKGGSCRSRGFPERTSSVFLEKRTVQLIRGLDMSFLR